MVKPSKLLLYSAIVINLLILGGCKAGEGFYKKIDEINHSVEQSDWKQTREGAEKLSNMYKDGKWKLQLLGDEAEYEGINVELEKLKEATNAKDKTQVKVSLGTIRAHLRDIYSF